MTYSARRGDFAGRFVFGAALLASAAASANVEVGAFGGMHVFSDHSELGVADGPGAPSQRNGGAVGLRFGVLVADLIGLEGEFATIPTVARAWGYTVIDIAYRAHLVLELRARDPDNVVVPFLVAGAGAFTVVSTADKNFKGDLTRDIAPDTDVAFYGGLGVKLRLGRSAGIRFDVRALSVPSSENTIPADPNSNKQTLDLEAFAGAYLDWGRDEIVLVRRPPPPPETPPAPPPPPADPDPDHDGIEGAADQCPNEPEDKDGFQDADGCPDLDNDSDGVPDAADHCPDEPEDRDGFHDDDGCPDPDNDGDGVPDASDACLDQLETKNGFDDTDGCPDTVPPELMLLDGVLPKVAFAPDTAKLTKDAQRTLDQVSALMWKYPDVKIAIGAHTDDQLVLRGLYADNAELSQARAEAVEAYLSRKGIDVARMTAKGFADTQPRVPPAGLTGKKLAVARAANRRVELHLVSPLP